jgi:cell division protein FtsX
MSDTQKKPVDPMRHFLAMGLLVGGVIILAAISVFLWLALGFRQSFTSSLPPIEDMALGLAALSPFVLLALLMIGYGRRLLRRE